MFSILNKKYKAPNVGAGKDVEYSKEVLELGASPIFTVAPPSEIVVNDFGHIRNDIDLFLSAPNARSVDALNSLLSERGSSGFSTIQEAFDSIVPRNVQTPSEIVRFGDSLKRSGRFDKYIQLKDASIVDEPTSSVSSVVDGDSSKVD